MPRKGYKQTEEHRRKISEAERGDKNPRWKGGRRKCSGYIMILLPTHPYADNRGYVLEHRLVMERHIGRTLLPTEVVHHINGVVDDNYIENLMLFKNIGYHLNFHLKQRKQNISTI